MLKVLSTKLKVEEIKRFGEIAEQQSESKSGLLRRLVLEYLNNYSEADRVASTGTSSPANSSEKGLLTEKTNGDGGLALSQNPSLVKLSLSEGRRCQEQAGSPTSASMGDNRLPNVDHSSGSLSLSKESLPVYQNHSKGIPETSKHSSKGWLLLLGLVVLWLNSRSSSTVDRESALTTQLPNADEQGLYAHRVGNTIVYSSSPIPFW
jgi:hypothetical protein